MFANICPCIIPLFLSLSLSPLFGTKFLGLEVSSEVFFDHDEKAFPRQYVDTIGFALRFERAAWKNVETSKRFFLSFFFSATIDVKSSNCGLVNASDEKFGTGQSQVSSPFVCIRNVLQQRVRFLVYRL